MKSESVLGIIVQWNGSWHTCNPKTQAESISEMFHWLQESRFSDPKTEDIFVSTLNSYRLNLNSETVITVLHLLEGHESAWIQQYT